MTKGVRLYQARTPSAQPSYRLVLYLLLTLRGFMQVDAFTTRRFSGNPAAVCILEDEISDDIMQQIAAEMNLSETAFVRRLPSAAEGYHSQHALLLCTPLYAQAAGVCNASSADPICRHLAQRSVQGVQLEVVYTGNGGPSVRARNSSHGRSPAGRRGCSVQRAEVSDGALWGADCYQGKRAVPPQRTLASARTPPFQRCAALRCNLQGTFLLLYFPPRCPAPTRQPASSHKACTLCCAAALHDVAPGGPYSRTAR